MIKTISILDASKIASNFYDQSKRKGLKSGYEKTIVTDGNICIFSSTNYPLKKGEFMFMCVTRNENTFCKATKQTIVLNN